MKEMNRRDFIKNVAIGGAVLGLGGALFHKPMEALHAGKGVGIELRRAQPTGREFPTRTLSVCAAGS